MTESDYVHGYSERENVRLYDQADTLSGFLHSDTSYPAGSRVLEAGCGVGAQTVILAKNSPTAKITSVDLTERSVKHARELVRAENISNVGFRVADIYNPPFREETFDHIFVCFVLEHMSDPLRGLQSLRSVLKPGGSITVIEGDHGSAYFHPRSDYASKTIQCLIDLQEKMGGDSLIGRRLFPLLNEASFKNVSVSPRMIYIDSSRPRLVEGFTRNTFIAMVEGVRDEALKAGIIDQGEWAKGISDLYETAGEGGTFCYTFFKGTALK